MTFYDWNGNSILFDKFVELYSDCYFLGNKRAKSITYSQSSKYVEEQVILPILNGHIETYVDLARIMAWKIGKIKQKESESKKKICYADDWLECEINDPMRYGRVMPLHKLSDYIIENRDFLETLADSNPQECLRVLRNQNTYGFGTVYLITLLFFLSHGKYPIYDRFAMNSLMAIENDIAPKPNTILATELPTKWDRRFATLCEREYREYIGKLNSLGMDYKTDRRIDRALWVYGHGIKCRRAG